MKLPNAEQALIDPRKLTDYCLNREHDDGKHKAGLFEELLAISLASSDRLIEMLERAARESDAVAGRRDQYGQRYVIDFQAQGVSETFTMRSAWIIRTDETFPRLVTCYILK